MLARVVASSAGAHRAIDTAKIAKTTNEEKCILNFFESNEKDSCIKGLTKLNCWRSFKTLEKKSPGSEIKKRKTKRKES